MAAYLTLKFSGVSSTSKKCSHLQIHSSTSEPLNFGNSIYPNLNNLSVLVPPLIPLLFS
ncbi:hypothetical protein HanHA89_Chr16g0676051 [Helianthus annuus]|nr:hypothetical protein HanHA89_Chr16g0676051 [Helianthus annuus]